VLERVQFVLFVDEEGGGRWQAPVGVQRRCVGLWEARLVDQAVVVSGRGLGRGIGRQRGHLLAVEYLDRLTTVAVRRRRCGVCVGACGHGWLKHVIRMLAK